MYLALFNSSCNHHALVRAPFTPICSNTGATTATYSRSTAFHSVFKAFTSKKWKKPGVFVHFDWKTEEKLNICFKKVNISVKKLNIFLQKINIRFEKMKLDLKKVQKNITSSQKNKLHRSLRSFTFVHIARFIQIIHSLRSFIQIKKENTSFASLASFDRCVSITLLARFARWASSAGLRSFAALPHAVGPGPQLAASRRAVYYTQQPSHTLK